jgi:hypothetical protein
MHAATVYLSHRLEVLRCDVEVGRQLRRVVVDRCPAKLELSGRERVAGEG